MTTLTTMAAERRLKLSFETEGDPKSPKILPCARGGSVGSQPPHIYEHGPDRLAFTGSIPGVRRRLLQIPGVLPHQTGDQEFTVVFPVSAFEAVAGIARPRRKRPGRSAEAMRAMREAAAVEARE